MISSVVGVAQVQHDAECVMRRAIVSAPLHLRGIKHYEANVYIRGSVVFSHIPTIFEQNLGERCPQTNYAYILENFSFMQYDAPNTYTQSILSEQNNIPDAFLGKDFTLKYFNFNFYNQSADDIVISPLSRNAHAYYRFELVDSLTTQGEVYGIRVEPRISSKRLFKGVICIDDGSWQLSYVNLSIETAVGTIGVEQEFVDIGDNVNLIRLQTYHLDLSLLGIKGKGEYIEQHSYSLVRHDDTEGVVGLSPKLTRILSNEHLARRDMRRGLRYSRRLASELDSVAGKNEITTRNRYYVVDTNKITITSRDWDNLRPDELNDVHKRSIETISTKTPQPKYVIVEQPHPLTYLFSPKWHVGKGLDISLSGIDPTLATYHPVTGLSLQQRAAVDYTRKIRLNANAMCGYAFADKRFWYEFGGAVGIKSHTLSFKRGDKYVDWKGDKEESWLNNSLTSFLFKRNFKVLARNRFWHVGYTSSPLWGMKIDAGLHVDSYTPLENKCNFSVFRYKQRFTPNEVRNGNITTETLQPYTQATAHLRIEYTPRLKYFVTTDGRKRVVGSSFPTIALSLTQGVSALRGNTDFLHLNLSLMRKKTFSMTDCFNWEIEGGVILNPDNNGFATWQHFRGSHRVFGLARVSSGYEGFVTFEPYELSTNDWYAKFAAHYQSQSLFVKRLSPFRNWLFTEELHFKLLTIAADDIYTEIGYGFGQILLVLRTTAFVSFHNDEFQAVNFRMSFSLGDLLKQRR